MRCSNAIVMKFDSLPAIANAPAVPLKTVPVGPPATWTGRPVLRARMVEA
jgi:hypothetical protein